MPVYVYFPFAREILRCQCRSFSELGVPVGAGNYYLMYRLYFLGCFWIASVPHLPSLPVLGSFTRSQRSCFKVSRCVGILTSYRCHETCQMLLCMYIVCMYIKSTILFILLCYSSLLSSNQLIFIASYFQYLIKQITFYVCIVIIVCFKCVHDLTC